MTVAGELYLLPTPSGLTAFRASIMSVLESGSLVRMETPTSDDVSDRTPSKNFIITKTGRARHVNKTGIQSQERLSQNVKRLPTPTVDGNYNRKGASATSGDGLATVVKNLPQRVPTPKASPAGPDFAKLERSATGISLPTWVAMVERLPTPTASEDHYRLGGDSQQSHSLGAMAARDHGGPLNPEWVEWLMGWPIGWTGLEPLATDKFQQWLNSHLTP